MTTVWIAESGEYEQRGVDGVYDCPERAMAAIGGNWTREIWQSGDGERWEEWRCRDESRGYPSVRPYEIEDAGPLAERLKTAVVQRWERPDPRSGWRYDEVPTDEADAIMASGDDPGDNPPSRDQLDEMHRRIEDGLRARGLIGPRNGPKMSGNERI